jgi:Uma2 family endonuclease
MILPQPKPALTPDEYIAWEATQPEKHEYVAGEVFAMVGARRAHVRITLNLAGLLGAHLRGSGCQVFGVDMKLRVEANNAFYYPDILVTCDSRDLAADLYMQHPKVLIEVLSESTAAHDRGDKFAAYRQLASLEEYALIDPDRRTIDVFRRMPDGNWLLATAEAVQGLVLRSLDFVAAPEAVFEDVEAPASGTA